jgi:hypothetical protein
MKLKLKIQIIDTDEDTILYEGNYFTLKDFRSFNPERTIEGVVNGWEVKKPNGETTLPRLRKGNRG